MPKRKFMFEALSIDPKKIASYFGKSVCQMQKVWGGKGVEALKKSSCSRNCDEKPRHMVTHKEGDGATDQDIFGVGDLADGQLVNSIPSNKLQVTNTSRAEMKIYTKLIIKLNWERFKLLLSPNIKIPLYLQWN